MRGRLLWALSLAGCGGLLSPRPTAPITYFTLEDGPAEARETSAVRTPVRLAPVRSAASLDERVVWRRGEYEAGFDEGRRWLDLPGPLLERALSRELYERRGLVYGLTLDAMQLEIDLERFEEVLSPAHEARVVARVSLLDPAGTALFVRSFAAARPVTGEAPTAFPQAMSAAVAALASQIGDAAEAALRK
jgi:ABC-type uncharacterized transport system auxiliary subunit